MSDDKGKSKYVPDYDSKCDICGLSPTVTIEVDGKKTSDLEMCGPCTFGESSAIYPEEWN